MTTVRRLRIAILCCFTFPERITKERGGFDDIFAAWIFAAVDAYNGKRPKDQVAVDFTGFDVFGKDQYPTSLDDIDALIVTGSAASAYDNEPWIHRLAAFLQDTYENNPSVKIFGGCFGHQIVCQALLAKEGARVFKNPNGWEIGVHEIDLTPEFTSFFSSLDKSRISYQFLHQDIVESEPLFPKGWIQMGSSALCKVQGLLLPGRVLTYQGHPEFDRFITRESTIAVKEAGLISDSENMDELFELVEKDDTRALAGEMVVEFFMS
ncbi:gmp synthase [Colletotrichum karsti]|uniref:Gmp synthase n=1 Tax=Colletotrichum karsti TaxID=1095194 RepID=A0A9P6LHM6_9PEZI|nr:gmp synthase [Colletotrichum karsti]KAF9873748.1 gmp synthase [Colletotrichum karsti]